MTARTLSSSLILVAALGAQLAAADTIITGTINFTPQASCPSCTTLLPTAGSFTYDQTTSTFVDFTVTYDGATFDFVHDVNGKDSANNPTISGSVPCLSGATGGAATFALLTACSGSASQQLAGDAAIWYTNSSPGGSLFDFYLGADPGVVTVAESSTGYLPTSAGDYSVTLSQSGMSNTSSITVAPTALNFQILQGSPAQSQPIQIGGTAGTAWQATATTSTGVGWLSISPVSGQVSASITVSVNAGGLAAGSYQGTITVESPGPPPSTGVSVSVALIVAASTGQAGIITTLAGNGEQGFSGDGGPATSASLNIGSPSVVNLAEVAVDTAGNLFIADSDNSRIRKVSANGIITTVAGDGATGSSGDGGPAT
jgi:Viral BACON domain